MLVDEWNACTNEYPYSERTRIVRQADMLQMTILTHNPSNASGTLRSNFIMFQKQLLDACISPNERQAQQTKYGKIDTHPAKIERRDGSVTIVELYE